MEEQNHKPFASVIIITRNRPIILADCLDHLARQNYTNFETIVVDSSDNYETSDLIALWPSVQYLSIWAGRNNMPAARNLGLSRARGEIVAFIDDDAMVYPGWLENIVSGYSTERIGGVGGRTIDTLLKVDENDPRIGQVYADGTVVQNFSRALRDPVSVDWFIGCNMSFRRKILTTLRGFDQNYGGNNSFEDVDMSTRVRKSGYDLVLVPTAVVDHVFAPRAAGTVSRDYENPRVRYHLIHNRAYFVTKNYGLNKLFLGYVFNTLFGMTTSAVKKPRKSAWTLLGATFWGFISGSWDAYILRIR
jgi:glycosyltransferase involved in cell wall biosynthesis